MPPLLNILDHVFKKLTFGSFLLVLNHMRIKVACKVAKLFLTLFPVTLVKVEVQESSLHQMNHKKVYFLPCFMQNVQKLNMVGCRALNDWSNHYGPPCSRTVNISWLKHFFSKMYNLCLNYLPMTPALFTHRSTYWLLSLNNDVAADQSWSTESFDLTSQSMKATFSVPYFSPNDLHV